MRNRIQFSFRRGFDTFYGSYLGVLDHFTHVRDKYEGYDFHKDEKVLFNASGRWKHFNFTPKKFPFQVQHSPLWRRICADHRRERKD